MPSRHRNKRKLSYRLVKEPQAPPPPLWG
ncbi:MAG: hypothetical protein QOH67_3900, partial [Hyphomicrobiales bacterium]|nr:hypothetical protein [Hyphomicrobiales bacterium]